MKNFRYFLLMLTVVSFTVFSCKDDDTGPADVAVLSITADGTSFEDGAVNSKDLNGASSATDVALNATFTITFDKEVDATTATSSNVQILRDGNAVGSTVTGSGSTITIKPTEDLQRGTAHTLSISNVAAADGGMFTTVTRTFTTEGRAPVVVPNVNSQIAYWNFDANTDDATGEFNANNSIALTYGEDRFGQGNSTASFDGDETIIEVPDAGRLLDANDFTVSFWMKANSTDHVDANGNPANHFVMGLGAFLGFGFEVAADFNNVKAGQSYVTTDGVNVAEDMFFPGTPLTADSWQGWEFHADLTGSGGVEAFVGDKWAHVILTYNAAEKKGLLYFNGQLMKSQDFDLWPDGDVKRNVEGVTFQGTPGDVENILAFGFIKSVDSPMWSNEPWGNYNLPTSNHFKGDLDDVRIFSAPFSQEDATALYNAEK